jgi:subtilisin
VSIRESVRKTGGLLLVAALLIVATFGSAAAAPTSPARDYIVTLDVADAVTPLRTAGRRGRQRMRARADATREATRRLTRSHGFRVGHRYSAAVAGFSARLTPAQAARLGKDASVAHIRPARQFRIASQVVPSGMERTRAIRSGGPHADVDADIAVLDTGIGPVGGGELNIAGGINCSGDGLADNAWDDRFSSHHGTHVAGIAAARDNDIGSIGVAPGARLWSVRVFSAGGFGTEATIICGLDWVVATHSATPPPGSHPIEVVNMSLQGPRQPGGPDVCGVATDPDLMHVALCSVHAAGITTVAAAGNSASSVSNVSPAAYDQVITVGAVNDYDGRGGSLGSACEFWKHEEDDRYAGYSNYGNRVDIVAPGTCVRSTQPSSGGDQTRLLSGTSMASPHVAGAIARYLADHPGIGPEAMREIVRAAGRLDWVTSSDPVGRSAALRLLDVRALNGAALVRPWVSPAKVSLGVDQDSRTVRVDIQRYGGFGGDVTLDVTGLPNGVTDSKYDPGRTLSGRSQLGATMKLKSAPGSDDFNGTVRVRARGPGGEPTGGRYLSLVNDRNGPAVSGLSARIRSGRRALGPNNRASVRLRWNVTDVGGSVAAGKLQQRVRKGKWKTIARGPGARAATTTVTPGKTVTFRVSATDGAGNKSTSSIDTRLSVRDSSGSKITRASGNWTNKASRKAIGGSVVRSTQADATLTSAFEGTGVAIVAPLGPGRGKLRVRVDNGAWSTITLKQGQVAHRRVVYSRVLEPRSHVIEVRRVTGRPAVDALLISR